ncbi:PREDICTED: DNA polymerase I B, chloroplastic/mitochondrial-like [Ipomoea nil]|uniref:DNA polymerase I B, chloroplastic/mitochondrial-like n=1 Tax=Ipomoea nil TaxID=35883 RepID=UPI000901537D|nr:PREDICTED: DNA polymerase I B, chloroplastic/mitochondrial-like [Ipomoea nil]
MAVVSFSTQTATPVKRSSFAPNRYFWLCPRSFSTSHSFWFSCSPKACHRGEDCKTLSADNALSSLSILGDSCQIKRTLRHEIKPFSSGIAQRIEEDYVAARSAWGAEAEAIRQDRRRNGSFNNVAYFDEYRYIDSSNNSAKDKRYGVIRNAKGSLILEHATYGPKPHYNSSSGQQKAPKIVQFRHHLPQSSVHVSQPRSNELRSIDRVGGSTLSLDHLLPNDTQPIGLLPNKTNEKKAEKTFKLDDDIPIKQMERDVSDFVESSTLNQTKLAKCTAPEKSITQDNIRERLESIYDKVFIVDNISVAKEVVSKLTNDFRDFIHACDTEVAKINVKQETPVGHGEITCFSIYSGPDADFGNGKSCVWVDVLDGGGKDILVEFAPFFEDPSIKKVWHNYSFDCHIIENYGFKVSGFHADTMHMARLWDSSRRTEGGYSLEALTGDHFVMCDARVSPGEELLGKVSMKTIFGRKKLKKDGTEGKVDIIPSVEELQRVERKSWICYSALDSISTLMLYESLKTKLTNRVWKLDGFYKGNMLNFYERYWLPFGELLVHMETEGMLVDRAYLAELEKVAKAEQEIASNRFRNWASKHCPDAKYMNVGSDAQLRQLFFGGTLNRKDPNESLENKRDFKVPNVENIIEEGKKAPSKFRKITLHKIGDRIETDLYTASGWPSVSGDALKALAGKISADFEIISEADDNVEEVSASSSDEPSVANNEAPCTEPEASGYGTAYKAFGGGKVGIEACHAIASLCEICSIDSLISNFILPLQGGEISGKNGRIHCSLNINTETGRLSARRPNLQNQPALEKDRYKIRQAFIAAPGNSLIVADYGQLELRILAHLANCKSMLAAFEAGGDFHSRTALNMYPHIREAIEQKRVLLEWDPQPGEDKPPVPLLKDAFASERRKAKMLNFSIAYGKTTVGLARDWKVSVKEAKETVDRWYSDRKEVLSWQEQRKSEAHQFGCVYTLLGRARWFPSLKKASSFLKGHIERAAINTPVQGSAADVAMCAMLEISKNPRLKELGWKLLLQVHDEVILEGPTESAEEAKAIVVHCMSNPFDGKNFLRVGLSVDAKCAQNWYSAK